MSTERLTQLELRIARFLRAGVLLAGVLMLVGWLLQLDFSGNPLGTFQLYLPQPFFATLLDAFHGQDWAMIFSYVGLIVLISLPVIRVFLTAVLFVSQKEFTLAGIALFVLVSLMASVFLGWEI